MTEPVKLNTVGVIARKLSVPISRVVYILKTRPHIQPVALAGNTRLYNAAAVDLVGKELKAIKKNRKKS